MKHESAAPLLLQTLETRSEMNDDLRNHVEDCEECRTLTETNGALAQAFDGRDAPGSHLTSEEVVRLAMDQTASPRDEGLRAHLRACARCAWEVRNVRSAEMESTSDAPKPTLKAVEARSVSLNWPAIAGVFAVLLLLYPAYLGTFRLPAVAEERRAFVLAEQEAKARLLQVEGSLSETRDLLSRVSAWTGPVQVPVLSPLVRGREPRVAQVPVETGQPFLALALDLTSAGRLVTPGIHRVRVVGADAKEVFALEIGGSEIQERIAVGGVLTVFVPAGRIPRGSYSVTVAPSSGSAIFESLFSVTTGGFQPAGP
jgi:hypothetical protein